MMRIGRGAVTVLVAVGVAAGAWVAAAPQARNLAPPTTVGSTARADGQPGSSVRLLAAKVPHSSLTYLPVRPCRLVYTAVSTGPLPAGVTKMIRVKGSSGIAAQGGKAGGCGIPEVAVAVGLAFTSTGSSAAGDLRAWPASGTEPLYSVLSFGKGQPASGTATVEISGSTSTGNLKLRPLHAATQLTVTVAGYYVAPIAAAIAANGTPISATDQIGSTSHPSTGDYRIALRTRPTDCAVLTTPLWANVTVTARLRFQGFGLVIEVLTRNNATGTFGNYPFFFEVVC